MLDEKRERNAILFLWGLVLCAIVGWATYEVVYQEEASEWQSAYAEMVANSGDCGGVAVAQKILRRKVSGWPELTEEEANVVFADWRGDMRGGLIAPLLRHRDVEGDYHEVIPNDDIEASNDAEWRGQ